jgi:hypothetical protein
MTEDPTSPASEAKEWKMVLGLLVSSLEYPVLPLILHSEPISDLNQGSCSGGLKETTNQVIMQLSRIEDDIQAIMIIVMPQNWGP